MLQLLKSNPLTDSECKNIVKKIKSNCDAFDKQRIEEMSASNGLMKINRRKPTYELYSL